MFSGQIPTAIEIAGLIIGACGLYLAYMGNRGIEQVKRNVNLLKDLLRQRC